MPRRVSYTFLAVDKFSAVANRIKAKSHQVRKSLRSIGHAAIDAGNKIKGIGAKLKKFSGAAAAATVGAVKAYSDLEHGLTNVLTLLTAKEIETHRKSLKGMLEGSIKYGFSIGDASKALFDNVSALGANEEQAKAFGVAQKLAIGGVTELRVAMAGLNAIMNAYGKETTDANEVAHAFFTAQRFGTVTVAELNANVGNVAPFAKQAGVGYKELLATMAQLTQGGIKVEQSSTALRGIFTALLNPAKDAEAVLTRIGVPIKAEGMRKAGGLTNILDKLAIAAEKYPNLLNEAIPNIRAFLAAATLGRKELARVDMITNVINQDIQDGTGYLSAYEMQHKTLTHETKVLWGNVKLLASQLGEQLKPAVSWVVTNATKLVEKFQALTDQSKKVVAWTMAFASALSTLVTGIGIVLVLLGKGALVAAALVSPFFWIPVAVAAAIAALIALGVYMNEKFEMLRNLDALVWSTLKGWVGLGDDTDVNVNKHSNINAQSKSTIDMFIHAPKGTVKYTKAKTQGYGGPSLGMNMVEEH